MNWIMKGGSTTATLNDIGRGYENDNFVDDDDHDDGHDDDTSHSCVALSSGDFTRQE